MASRIAASATVRAAKPGDEDVLHQLTEKEEWDLSVYDYKANMNLDPEFLLVAVDLSDTPIGFIGLTKQTADTMYLSDFIVREDFRGKGVGQQLWSAMLLRAANMTIALDSVSELVNFYKKKGFAIQSFWIKFYKLTLTSDMKENFFSKYQLLPLTEELWPALKDYDKQVYPEQDRENILRAWFQVDDATVIVALDSGRVVGYGSIHRKPNNEYGLRNVFGDEEDVVEDILRSLFVDVPVNATVYFMLVKGKPLPKYMKKSEDSGYEALRMYTKHIATNEEKMWFATSHML